MDSNPANQLSEIVLHAHLEISDALSQDTQEHLEEFQEDLAYLLQSVEQVQTRFAKVLAENRRLKGFLLEMVKNCSCQEGRRCPQCQQILGTLSHFGI
ncbi:hypothetical protein [Kamptonema formosum]|uniref:hypothetical protein n=1 Tax=Kamptonema formosum TaxID=331992 RepID=UPI00034C835C|nr:hypothetical protein [Oscillatoria sp. PCC 10802]